MLVREGEDRSAALDQRLAAALALVAGALNAAGFCAVGVFSANMTGNVSALADRVAFGDLLAGLFYLAVLATFMAGAAVSSLLISAGKRRGLSRVYAGAILAEAALLAALGLADILCRAEAQATVLVFGLAFLMGLQNAVVTRISDARVRTTHVSGVATDVGIALGGLIDVALRRGGCAEARAFREKLGLHGATILAFCVGGIAGVALYRVAGAGLLFGAAGLLAGLAAPALRRTERASAGGSDRRHL